MNKLPQNVFISILSVFLVLFLCINTVTFAATTGKVDGTIVDSQSKEPLPGVNVVIEGTIYGAATDENGYFFIINVPPGTYDLKASMVGYATETKENVRIYVDRTTKVDISLKTQAVAGEEVTVTADRVPVPLDVSATEVYVSGEDISESSVTRFDDMIGLQAGVTLGANLGEDAIDKGTGFSIRGGDISETDIQIDGISMRDEFTQIPNMAVSRNLIQDVQILTGGFNAEYGNVRSGLVNVITKDGSYNRYSGVLEGRLSPADRKHRGTGPFDWNSVGHLHYLGNNWNVWNVDATGRDYVEPDRLTGWSSDEVYLHDNWITAYEADLTAGNPDPGQDYLDDHPYSSSFPGGWNQIGEDKPYTRETAIDIYKWNYRAKKYGETPDQMFDVGFGGPIPGIPNTKFYASQYWNKAFYVYPTAREYSSEMSNTFKVTNRIKSNMSLTAMFGYQYFKGTSNTPTNRWIEYGYVNAENSAAGYSGNETSHFIWEESTQSPRTLNSYYGELKFVHTYSPSTYYDISVGVTRRFNETNVIRDRDLTKVKFIDDVELAAAGWKDQKLNLVDGTYGWVDGGLPVGRIGLDERPRGFWDAEATGLASNFATDRQQGLRGWLDLNQNTFSDIGLTNIKAKVNIVSQVNKYNQIKAGIEFERIHLNHFAYFGYGVDSDPATRPSWFGMYKADPMQLDAFFQDKLEWEGLILNWGVRGTMWYPNTDGFDLTASNRYNEVWSSFLSWPNAAGEYIEGEADYKWQNEQTRKIKQKILLQPRLGISHPITQTSKIFFNYGHFYQRPTLESMYFTGFRKGIGIEQMGGTGHVPVPDGIWPKTVSYEIGYSQSIYDEVLLQISGYYKDYTNEASRLAIVSYYGDVDIDTRQNNGYRDVRGLEFRIERSFGRFFNFWANYNYMIQSEGSTGLDVLYENAILADEQWATFVQSRAETLPSFRSSITLRTPVGFGPGPAILGIKPLAEWRFNTIITWRDGGKFIVNQSADPEDWLYVHRVDRKMVDLYVSKRIAKGANLYINVQNLFDIKYFNGASGYGDSLRYPWTTPSGNDKYGEYERWYVAKRHRDGYLMWNSNKRDVFIGIRYMF